MYIVAVKDTTFWQRCENELEVAELVKKLMSEYPQERIIVAEELDLVVLEGEIQLLEEEPAT
ncbi:hypothetical protein [Calderihabitans maritimus]|uniref:Uncharacterized protein n=1 Tax=Calderihabitans maritimus TaxID=1246530 RepID=A0A1Z5HMT2_9FIRM|nr:hypothetical protein [Calderihabitans maritimus]GAW90842.1 hypothetical protein KKC1_00040 [Calderihabitans maritimus]